MPRLDSTNGVVYGLLIGLAAKVERQSTASKQVSLHPAFESSLQATGIPFVSLLCGKSRMLCYNQDRVLRNVLGRTETAMLQWKYGEPVIQTRGGSGRCHFRYEYEHASGPADYSTDSKCRSTGISVISICLDGFGHAVAPHSRQSTWCQLRVTRPRLPSDTLGIPAEQRASHGSAWCLGSRTSHSSLAEAEFRPEVNHGIS